MTTRQRVDLIRDVNLGVFFAIALPAQILARWWPPLHIAELLATAVFIPLCLVWVTFRIYLWLTPKRGAWL